MGQRGPLGRGAVEIILGNYGEKLGIKITLHMLRHSLAYQLIKRGGAMTTIHLVLYIVACLYLIFLNNDMLRNHLDKFISPFRTSALIGTFRR